MYVSRFPFLNVSVLASDFDDYAWYLEVSIE